MSSDRQANNSRDQAILDAFKYRDALITYAYSILRDWDSAEDVLQESLVVMLNDREGLKQVKNTYAWLCGILRRKSLEILRNSKKEYGMEEDKLVGLVAESLDKHFDENQAKAMEEMRGALRHCLTVLNDSALDLLEGFYWRRESSQNLAAIYNRSVNAVKLMLSRIRKKLRKCVALRLATLETTK